jgi:hypothetical protein
MNRHIDGASDEASASSRRAESDERRVNEKRPQVW